MLTSDYEFITPQGQRWADAAREVIEDPEGDVVLKITHLAVTELLMHVEREAMAIGMQLKPDDPLVIRKFDFEVNLD